MRTKYTGAVLLRSCVLLLICVLAGCAGRQGDMDLQHADGPSEPAAGTTTSGTVVDVGRAATGAADEEQRVEASSRDEAQVIVTLVQQSQRAGLIDGDHVAFTRVIAADARIVYGRGESEGPHDTIVPGAQLKAFYDRQGGIPEDATAMDYKDVVARTAGNEATIAWRVVIRDPDSAYAYFEHYKLRRESAGWRVTYNRTWPVSRELHGDRTVYDGSTWDHLDERVQAARASGSQRELLVALHQARRFGDGLVEARRLSTTAGGTDAAVWAMRGIFAQRFYRFDEMSNAFDQALALDPKTEFVPRWYRERFGKPTR